MVCCPQRKLERNDVKKKAEHLKITFKCIDGFAATKNGQRFLIIELVLLSIFTVNVLGGRLDNSSCYIRYNRGMNLSRTTWN